MPTNAGVLQNTVEPGSYDAVSGWINNIKFNTDPYYYLNNVPAGAEAVFIKTPKEGAPSSFALVDRDFKMPMVWRTSVGADYKIPNSPFVLTGDFLYTKDINAVFQLGANRRTPNTFLNYGSSGEEGDYGDNRAFYPAGVNGSAYNSKIGANNATVLTNTNVKGHAVSATLGLSVPNYKGLSGSVFYNYASAKEVSANAGSSASSAWGGSATVNGPNDQILHPSAFAIPHRVMAHLSYRLEYANHLATTVGVYYNGSSQGRFSYTYYSDINRDGQNADLIYLPKNLNSLTFVDRVDASGKVLFTAAQQAEALEKFVKDNGLEKYQGKYLPRNGFMMPWLNRFDVKVLQDIFTNIGGRKNSLQLSLDVINFGNLLNKNWGIQSRLNNGQLLYGNKMVPGVSGGKPVLNTANTPTTGIPEFNMNVVNGELPTTPFQNVSTLGTTWQMQLGVRYTF